MNIKNWPKKPLPAKDVAHCLCALVHDEENLEPGQQVVMEVRGLTRNDDEKLGDYKIIVQRVR